MNPTNPYEEHWTPSTRDVRMSYTDNRYQEWGAEMEEADAEFDRWFARELEKARRKGWEERARQDETERDWKGRD